MEQFRVIWKYLRSNRINDYRDALSAAQRAGYTICSVRESLDLSPTQPQLVLRHDVDHVTNGPLRMAEVEQHMGVHATYYFRWTTFDIDLIRRFHAMGHECSLHYETFATYAHIYDLAPADTPIDATIIAKCQERLGREIAMFRSITATHGCRMPVETIASHGHPINRQFQFPNNMLATPAHYSQWNVLLEAYDPSYLGRFDCYISDTHLFVNRGWRYGMSPTEAIAQRIPAILLLTHPSRWQRYSYAELPYLVRRVVNEGLSNQPLTFAYEHHLRGRATVA